jgi:hypothetical protein
MRREFRYVILLTIMTFLVLAASCKTGRKHKCNDCPTFSHAGVNGSSSSLPNTTDI